MSSDNPTPAPESAPSAPPKSKLSLTHWILIALVLGTLTGYFLNEGVKVTTDPDTGHVLSSTPTVKLAPWLGTAKPHIIAVAKFFAEIFKRLLKMIIVPLVFTSIISGLLSVGSGNNLRRMGLKTLAYYVCSSFAAILTGLVMVNAIGPGLKEGVTKVIVDPNKTLGAADTSLIDILIRMIPTNIVKSAAEGQMLPIIFFAVLVGIFITRLEGERRKTLDNLVNGGFDVMMKITQFVLWFAPIGIWGFLTIIVQETGFDYFVKLGWYALCVVCALAIHAFVTLPLAVALIGRYSPLAFAKHMNTALLTAFSTASSSATLPVTLECIEDKAKVSNRVSSFVLPLGATVNMDGTALYECVAVIFIAQLSGFDLTWSDQGIVVLTALLASIGAAGIPMAGMVMMSIVLAAVGLPPEGALLVLAVDRVLDMCRTTVNVWSDSCGALIIARTEGAIDETTPDANTPPSAA